MLPKDKETICILLASYNGESFLSDQLESLQSQTYSNWNLFIRDDGSTDGTVAIINKYAAKDKRISFLDDGRKNLGSCQNFASLIHFTREKYEYYMFCDQDDFWLPGKIKDTLVLMQEVQKQQEKETPIVVYTNFLYVDRSLQVIESKKDFQTTKVSNLRFAHLLAQNPAYGCTMMINKQLAAIIDPIPAESENHDYWVALVATALGKISYLNKQTLLYRQHNNNISTNYDSNSLSKRLKRIVLQRKNFEDVQKKITMASIFRNVYYDRLPDSKKRILNEFISLGTGKSLALLIKNIKNGVRRQTLLQTILFYVSILGLRNKKV
ncbi:glycosyltransferase family 2 protein [Segetibacter koreensis]|uniref:glycosyltransferase family 2 protein n=1 Tax=Segetibacter koreensis TaxID=398037 RepID=UPI000360A72F|nr:glycosyltransferase family 2 protein [Segetibacter koreensis]